MNKITRPQYIQSQYAAARLNPLNAALSKIDEQSLNHDQEVIDKFNQFRDFITPIIANAVEAVEAAQQQYNNRDQDLLSAASTRLHRIDDDVHLSIINKNDLSTTYQNKIEELKKQQFTPEEISKIVTNPDDEIAALDVAVKALKAEKVKIQSYLGDSPTYDESLLEGTKVFLIS